MPAPKNHAMMQNSVCGVCFKKPKNLMKISARSLISIKEHYFPDYDCDTWSWLPHMICSGCYRALHEVSKNPR